MRLLDTLELEDFSCSFKTIKSLFRPVAPQCDNCTKYIFSGYWITGIASIMQLLEEATLGCIVMPSVRWAYISSQVLTSFLARLSPCGYVPERKDMSNWGQCESQFTVIISGREQWEGTSPNEASVGSKAALSLAPTVAWQWMAAGARKHHLEWRFLVWNI